MMEFMTDMQRSPIKWLIRLVGDLTLSEAGNAAKRSVILTEADDAGFSNSTIRHYLSSAAHYGHVDPKTCSSRWMTPKRPIYFERTGRGQYTLSPRGWGRYVTLASEPGAWFL